LLIFDFIERLEELNQELERLNREVRELEGTIALNVRELKVILMTHIPQFHYESINTLIFKENDSPHFQSLT
jgi:hypothetical protein